MNRTAEARVLLQEARKIIEDKSRWTQGAAARTAEHLSCVPTLEAAVCWCSLGAVDLAAYRLPIPQFVNRVSRDLALRALDRAAFELEEEELGRRTRYPGDRGRSSVIEWNDDSHRQHAEVLLMFDRAIARLEAQ